MKEWVLITGGAGFIGSHLSDFLLEKDYAVICMDNLLTGDIANISHTYNKDFLFVYESSSGERVLTGSTTGGAPFQGGYSGIFTGGWCRESLQLPECDQQIHEEPSNRMSPMNDLILHKTNML